MFRRAAISLLPEPSASRRRTSPSRGVRGSARGSSSDRCGINALSKTSKPAATDLMAWTICSDEISVWRIIPPALECKIRLNIPESGSEHNTTTGMRSRNSNSQSRSMVDSVCDCQSITAKSPEVSAIRDLRNGNAAAEPATRIQRTPRIARKIRSRRSGDGAMIHTSTIRLAYRTFTDSDCYLNALPTTNNSRLNFLTGAFPAQFFMDIVQVFERTPIYIDKDIAEHRSCHICRPS